MRTTPSQKLAAAKGKPRRHVDVEVLLDPDLSSAQAALQAELEAAIEADKNDPRLSGENPAIAVLSAALETFLLEAADSLATIRVFACAGDEWSDIESRSPARLDAPGDRRFGYNTLAATRLALPLSGSGWLVDGEVIPLVVTAADPTTLTEAVDEWADLFSSISGTEVASLESAVWEMNFAGPQVTIAEIKKALATRPA